jgi:hypothetical protein
MTGVARRSSHTVAVPSDLQTESIDLNKAAAYVMLNWAGARERLCTPALLAGLNKITADFTARLAALDPEKLELDEAEKRVRNWVR